MTFETWLGFAMLWLVAAAAPGPNVAYTVAAGLTTPLPRAFLAALGIGLGGLVYALAASAGLGALLAASAEAFAAVKWIGVAYLAWLGLRQWRMAGRAGDMTAPPGPRGGVGLCLQAALVMLANPKAALAYAAVFPAFVAPGAPALPQFAILSATAAAGSIAVHCLYVALASRLGNRPAMRARPALVQRTSGTIYLLAAAALALVRRSAAAAG